MGADDGIRSEMERKEEKATNTPYCNTLVAGQGSDPFDGGLAVNNAIFTPWERSKVTCETSPKAGVRNTSIVLRHRCIEVLTDLEAVLEYTPCKIRFDLFEHLVYWRAW
ncbi:hypothetical protein H101_05185 [Trichophyton interdigitale H6]|nr:hypothetical protein H101_05185 [Trichophyton interdigitale H6]